MSNGFKWNVPHTRTRSVCNNCNNSTHHNFMHFKFYNSLPLLIRSPIYSFKPLIVLVTQLTRHRTLMRKFIEFFFHTIWLPKIKRINYLIREFELSQKSQLEEAIYADTSHKYVILDYTFRLFHNWVKIEIPKYN